MIEWDAHDERYFSTGVDRGVLFPAFTAGFWTGGVAWNGIIGVTESGGGATTVLYRDGEIFFTDVEPGDYVGTLQAYTWPAEFNACLGTPEAAPGFIIENQRPWPFSLCYRSLVGNGTEGDMFGYQLHFVLNAVASLGSRTRTTTTDTTTPDEFSFDIVATPTKIPGYRPTAHFVIDTRGIDPETLLAIEQYMYEGGVILDLGYIYEVLKYGNSWRFIENPDGSVTGTAKSDNITTLDEGVSYNLVQVPGVDNLDGSYTLSDTP